MGQRSVRPKEALETFRGLDPHPLMAALAAGLPVTLLADLLDPQGPDSRQILAAEAAEADVTAASPKADPGTAACPPASIRRTGS
jgi:hypothetical protein